MSDIVGASDTELAYLAGFFDGEGSVLIKKPDSKRRQTLLVRVSQVHPSMLIPYQDLWSGSIKSRTNGHRSRDLWVWTVCASNASRCLIDLLPFLRLKVPHAEIGIRFQLLKEGPNELTHRRNRSRREEIYSERLSCHETLKVLNRRGAFNV